MGARHARSAGAQPGPDRGSAMNRIASKPPTGDPFDEAV